MVETTASMPVRASVNESMEEKSTALTVTVGGKVDLEVWRVRTVTSNLASRRAWRMAGPRLPVACFHVSL